MYLFGAVDHLAVHHGDVGFGADGDQRIGGPDDHVTVLANFQTAHAVTDTGLDSGSPCTLPCISGNRRNHTHTFSLRNFFCASRQRH